MSGIVALVAELSRAWGGWLPRELDLGGGYAAPRDPTGRLFPRLDDRDRSAPPIEEYAEVVTDTLRTELARRGLPADGLTLEIEPGRGLHADTGIHLATVRNIKREADPVPWRWVETDTTEMFLPDSMIEHNRWPVIVANRADDPPAGPADVVGMSCGFDLMVPQEPLPELREGDLVLLKGRTTDHLSRVFFAQFGPIGCWKTVCHKTINCDFCDELRPAFPMSTVEEAVERARGVV